MDAIKFIKESNRMCLSFDQCVGCPAIDKCSSLCKMNPDRECSAEEKLSIVEKWSEEHPVETRQSVFLKQYPEASIGIDGVLKVCPMLISSTHRDNNGLCAYVELECEDCRREFWMQEVE